MKRCDSDSDCRGGYSCFDMSNTSNPWGASVVDNSPTGRKVCISPPSGTYVPSTVDGGVPAVCRPYDGGFPDVGTGSDGGASSTSPDAEANDAGADSKADGA